MKTMKKIIKLFIILIVLSVGLYSCFPLSPYSYGSQTYRGRGYRDYAYNSQGYRGQGYRDYGYRSQEYRGHVERHKKHHERNRDRGDWNYNSPHE